MPSLNVYTNVSLPAFKKNGFTSTSIITVRIAVIIIFALVFLNLDNPLPTFFNIFFIRIPPNISSIYLCCNHSSINNYASQNIMLSFFAILLVFVYNFVGYFRVLFKILHFH